MTMELSYHAKVERADRLEMLEQVLGFTNPVMRLEVIETSRIYTITSSGIIIIEGLYDHKVITAYAGRVSQVTKIYALAGKRAVTPSLLKRVIKNEQRHPELFL